MENFDLVTMTTEVQSPNKKMKMNEDGCENFKDDASKEILQVEISRREKVSLDLMSKIPYISISYRLRDGKSIENLNFEILVTELI